MAGFLRAGNLRLNAATITHVDVSALERLEVTDHHGGSTVARGQDAIEIVRRLYPSAFEGRRLAFARSAWAVHNLVGHPVLQLAAWLGSVHLGLWIHELTIRGRTFTALEFF